MSTLSDEMRYYSGLTAVPNFGRPSDAFEVIAHEWLMQHVGQEGEVVMRSLGVLIRRVDENARRHGNAEELCKATD